MMSNERILFQAGDARMITTSEIAVTITIWVLTAAGAFFGTRAAWRRRSRKSADRQAQQRQR